MSLNSNTDFLHFQHMLEVQFSSNQQPSDIEAGIQVVADERAQPLGNAVASGGCCRAHRSLAPSDAARLNEER
jgi:hypothetical protein